MNNEYIKYIILILKTKSLFEIFKIIIKKILNRIYFSTDRYSKNNFPIYLKSENTIDLKNNITQFEDFIYTSKINSIDIKLASRLIEINKNINWEMDFKDPEDYESLHRWGWYIWILSNHKISKNEINWCLNQINSWVKKFHHNNDNKIINYKSLKWETYTISERVSNIILSSEILDITINKEISDSIFNQAKLIYERMEFFGENNTGNHIINNTRALYLAGVYFKSKKLIEISFLLIKNELFKLISHEGFLREGSSHYQFIFTRWIIEIYIFAKKSNDKNMLILLNNIIYKLFDACAFFLVKRNKNYDIPYFGDISPDYEPSWLIDIFQSKLFNKNYKKLKYNSWSNLFANHNQIFNYSFSNINFNKNILNKNSGWFRLSQYNHTIFSRINKYEPIIYPTHEHNDQGHLVCYYNNELILNDSGRANYLNDDYKSSIFHNTILINDKGISPSYKKYKKIYKFKNSIIFKKFKNFFIMSYMCDALKRFQINNYNRSVLISDSELKISDKFIILKRNKKYNIKRIFHFPAAIKIVLKDKNYFLIKDVVLGKIIINNKSKMNIFTGKDKKYATYSCKYGETINSNTMIIENHIQNTSRLNFKIEWIK